MRLLKYISIDSGTDLTALYRSLKMEYPKFFKMDILSRLGLLGVEMLVKDEQGRFEPRKDRAVIMFSRSGSLVNDGNFQKTVLDFPSPALFVYTLPNIVTGEIAIRNKYAGETSAYVTDGFDADRIFATVEEAFMDEETRSVICGWIDCPSESGFEAVIWLVDRDGEGFDSEIIKKIYYGRTDQ